MVYRSRPIWITDLIRLNFILLPVIGIVKFSWWWGLGGLAVAFLFSTLWSKWAMQLTLENIYSAFDSMYQDANSGSYIWFHTKNRRFKVVKWFRGSERYITFRIPLHEWPELVEPWRKDNTLEGLASTAEIDDRSGVHWLCLDAPPNTKSRVDLFKYILSVVDADLYNDVYAEDAVIAEGTIRVYHIWDTKKSG